MLRILTAAVVSVLAFGGLGAPVGSAQTVAGQGADRDAPPEWVRINKEVRLVYGGRLNRDGRNGPIRGTTTEQMLQLVGPNNCRKVKIHVFNRGTKRALQVGVTRSGAPRYAREATLATGEAVNQVVPKARNRTIKIKLEGPTDGSSWLYAKYTVSVRGWCDPDVPAEPKVEWRNLNRSVTSWKGLRGAEISKPFADWPRWEITHSGDSAGILRLQVPPRCSKVRADVDMSLEPNMDASGERNKVSLKRTGPKPKTYPAVVLGRGRAKSTVLSGRAVGESGQLVFRSVGTAGSTQYTIDVSFSGSCRNR